MGILSLTFLFYFKQTKAFEQIGLKISDILMWILFGGKDIS